MEDLGPGAGATEGPERGVGAADGNRYLAAIAESSHDAIIGTDLTGCVTFWSAGATLLYGWVADEAIGRPLADLTANGETKLDRRDAAGRHVADRLDDVSATRVAKDGRLVEVSVTMSPVRDDQGQSVGVAWIERDIGPRVQLERVAREAENKFRAAFAHAPNGIAIWGANGTADGRLVDANEAFCHMFGYSRDDVVGRSIGDFVHPDDSERDAQWRAELGTGAVAAFIHELRFQHAAGHSVWVRMSASTVGDGDHHRFVVAHVENVTERKGAELRLVHQAFHDPLTGLPNRHLAFDRLRIALFGLERDRGAGVALLYVDIDWFKTINDRFGHSAGDRVLIEVARRLQQVIRSPDTVARLGGDEFLVICANVTDDKVAVIANRVTDALVPPISLDSQDVSVTASVGVTIAHSSHDDPEALVHSADAAMYRAKGHGRGRFEMFDEALRTTAVSRLDLERDLHNAIDRGEFVQYYQPIFDLASGQANGMEALLRWERRGAELLAVEAFIGIAEESGLISAIGEWVVGQACEREAAWSAQFGAAAPQVAINLSGREAGMADIHHRVLEAAANTGANPSHLAIELTETVYLETVQSFLNSLRSLQEIGVRIVLDDFGTGYSSLAYLKRFPVDTLKIDKSFIDGLGVDDDDTAIVKAVIGLAHSLDITATAEGVEHPRQLEALRDLGCDAAQGYLLGVPLPAAAATKLLAAQSGGPPA